MESPMSRFRWLQICVATLAISGVVWLCSWPNHLRMLRADLRSPNIEVWEPAARELLKTGPGGVRTVLDELGTRASIINLDRALAFEPEASLEQCLPLLESKEPWLRTVALRALGLSQRWAGELAPWDDKSLYPRTSPEFLARVAPKMVALLADRDEDVRGHASISIAELGPHALPALWNAAASSDPLMRLGAEKTLGKIRSSRSVPVLERLKNDDDAQVRSSAAYAVAHIFTGEYQPDDASPEESKKIFQYLLDSKLIDPEDLR